MRQFVVFSLSRAERCPNVAPDRPDFREKASFSGKTGVKIEQFSCVERGKKWEGALVRESPPHGSKLSSFDTKSSGFSPDSSLQNTSNLASFLYFAQILRNSKKRPPSEQKTILSVAGETKGYFIFTEFPGCDRPIFCVQLLDILSSFVAVWRCRIVRFLLDLSQKSGCFCVLRLQFFRCRALSSEDLVHTRELQDLPSKLREKSR